MFSLQTYIQKAGMLEDVQNLSRINNCKTWYPEAVKLYILFGVPQVISATAGLAHVFPEGYSICIGTHDNFQFTVSHDTSDFAKIGNKTIELIKHSPNFLKNFKDGFYRSTQKFRTIADNIYFGSGGYALSTPQDIEHALTSLINAIIIPQSYGYYTDVFTFTENFWVTKYLSSQGHNFSQSETEQLFRPTAESFIEKYKADIFALDNDQLVKKYYWIKASYIKTPTLTDELIQQDRILFKESGIDDKNKQTQNAEQLNISSDEVQSLIIWIQDCITMQDERKQNVLMTNTVLAKIASRVATLVNVPVEILWHVTPHELLEIIKNKSIAKDLLDEIERRKIHAVWFVGQDGYEISTATKDIQLISEALSVKTADNNMQIKGHVACKGKAEGIVKIILSEDDFDKFEKGNVLVTAMTRPEFTPILAKAAAFVTDGGGLTSHDVVSFSKQKNIPCITATRIGTKFLKDGDRVFVDAEHGLVKIM